MVVREDFIFNAEQKAFFLELLCHPAVRPTNQAVLAVGMLADGRFETTEIESLLTEAINHPEVHPVQQAGLAVKIMEVKALALDDQINGVEIRALIQRGIDDSEVPPGIKAQLQASLLPHAKSSLFSAYLRRSVIKS